MSRDYNHQKYNLLSDEQKNQIHMEDLIKEVMEDTDKTDEDKFNQINTDLINAVYTDKPLNPIDRADFDQFAKEYNSIGIANKMKRGAELITAFVIKIAPKVIGMALATVGTLTDLVGTSTKVIGRNLPLGDIGATANHYVARVTGKRPLTDKNAPKEYDEFGAEISQERPFSPLPKSTLGAVSGVGKLVSELGSNIAGVGMAVQRATQGTISSPTKRFAKKIKPSTQGK